MIDNREIFRTKENVVMKARLVAKGYQQKCDMDVNAPVARLGTF